MTELIHIAPERYRVFGPADFGAPGLVARESIGPAVDIVALGPLVTVHDSTFEPRSGIGHHPHRGMERLFYILEGAVDHDDALNGITGHMATGDLGILTEGARGMLHSEWNNTDGPARAYIFVYPTDPTPETAAFGAVRDSDAPREQVAPGAVSKVVIGTAPSPLHGDVRYLADTTMEAEASFEVALRPSEAALLFAVGGTAVVADGSTLTIRARHTVAVPPRPSSRTLRVTAEQPSRVLHAVCGPGFGLRTRRA